MAYSINSVLVQSTGSVVSMMSLDNRSSVVFESRGGSPTKGAFPPELNGQLFMIVSRERWRGYVCHTADCHSVMAPPVRFETKLLVMGRLVVSPDAADPGVTKLQLVIASGLSAPAECTSQSLSQLLIQVLPNHFSSPGERVALLHLGNAEVLTELDRALQQELLLCADCVRFWDAIVGCQVRPSDLHQYAPYVLETVRRDAREELRVLEEKGREKIRAAEEVVASAQMSLASVRGEVAPGLVRVAQQLEEWEQWEQQGG